MQFSQKFLADMVYIFTNGAQIDEKMYRCIRCMYHLQCIADGLCCSAVFILVTGLLPPTEIVSQILLSCTLKWENSFVQQLYLIWGFIDLSLTPFYAENRIGKIRSLIFWFQIPSSVRWETEGNSLHNYTTKTGNLHCTLPVESKIPS